jgi:hypothetical protein
MQQRWGSPDKMVGIISGQVQSVGFLNPSTRVSA